MSPAGQSPHPGQIWVRPQSTQRYFEFTINPGSMITGSDVPKFEGESAATSPPGSDPANKAFHLKWDVSRRLRVKHVNPTPTRLLASDFWGPLTYNGWMQTKSSSFPNASLEIEPFPLSHVHGNDDPSVADEDNNPYSDQEGVIAGQPKTVKGKLASQDRVTAPHILKSSGMQGDQAFIKLHFGEFVRLEIGEGSSAKWYRVSDFNEWKAEQQFWRGLGGMFDSGSTVGNDNLNY